MADHFNPGDTAPTITATSDTEFPAAAALADAAAIPTTPKVGAVLEFYNGSTVDLARGDTTNGLDVDITRQAAYGTIAVGEVQGNTGATQNPTVACREVTIKAASDNAGKVYIGISTVTKADGTTDTTTGIALSPGEAITLPITNLNLTYRICDNAGDDFTYIALS